MAIVIKPITVEVSKPNIFQAIAAKQGDSNSRFLKVTFVNEGEKIPVLTTSIVAINAKRSDGQSDRFLGKAVGDGTAIVPIDRWILELAGYVNCDVSITDIEGRTLTSTSFSILVEEASYNSNDTPDEEQYDFLQELAEEVLGRIETKADKNEVSSAIRNTASGSVVVLTDVSSVEHTLSVKARSKNLIPYPYEFSSPNTNNGVTFTDNGDGTISVIGTPPTSYASCVLASRLEILANTEYTLSGGFSNCYVILTAHDKTSGAWKADVCSVMGTAKNFTVTEEIASTCYLRAYLRVIAGGTVDGTAYPMLETGTIATEFEKGTKVITYTPNEDGTVEGVTSLSPNTTLYTDTENVVLDVTYNADTKMYIDNKFAELAAMLLNS